MKTQLIENTDFDYAEVYQTIQNEELSDLVITSQILAGSVIKASRYERVVFTDCSFYGCNFDDVVFDNCVFENCTFEFSHLSKSFLNNTSFVGCKWIASSMRNSHFNSCHLERNFMAIAQNSGNEVTEKSFYKASELFFGLSIAA